MENKPIWFADVAVQKLLAIAEIEGIELRFVGGCVRDFVMDKVVMEREVGDIDLATPHLPEIVMNAFAKHAKVIPTGIAHGTVTVMIENQYFEKRGFEITTLRRDLNCDGRHASIEFVNNWEVDAQRRDFTMNALFMKTNGEIVDYVGGVDDAIAGRVRFIGDASARIEEDYLRILRYFRFLATHSPQCSPQGSFIDISINDSIELHVGKLAGISRERVANEMRKLLCAKNPVAALELMAQLGVWQIITDNAAINIKSFQGLMNCEKAFNIAPQAWLRLCAIAAGDAVHIATKWRTPKATQKYIHAMVTAPAINDEATLRFAVSDYGKEWVMDMLMLKDATCLRTEYLLKYLSGYQPMPCPVNGGVLLANGFAQGVALRVALTACTQAWLKSDGALNMEQLLNVAKNT